MKKGLCVYENESGMQPIKTTNARISRCKNKVRR